jgi:phage terminase large subunit GpA-like protein
MYVVQVHGIAPSESVVEGRKTYDIFLVDRFKIIKSERKDADGDTLWVKPHAYLEDWNLVTEQIVEKEYPLEDGTGFMSVKITGIDSGGKSGTTTKAYDYWRKMRNDGRGSRVQLLKGEHKFGAPRAEIDYPDTDRKDRSAGARGEIPVLFLNSNVLKDSLLGMLDREFSGGTFFFNKAGTPDEVYVEMTTEIKNDKGQWLNPAGRRNEAWDLGYYCLGICHALRVEHFDWETPPSWADEWSKNTLVRTVDKPKPFAQTPTTDYGFGDLGKKLG